MSTVQALAALNFLVAAAPTGFGPFLNVALTGRSWTRTHIGIALSVGAMAALVRQVPGGALVDAFHQKRFALAILLAVTGITVLAVLPVRGLLLAILPGAVPLVCAEAFDGISGAVMGIMVPLVSADLTRRTGFLNLAIGSLGLAAGVGATASTAMGAWLADRAGTPVALLGRSLVGFCAFAGLSLLPETRPSETARLSPSAGYVLSVGSHSSTLSVSIGSYPDRSKRYRRSTCRINH